MTEKSILVIYTGGTIGMQPGSTGLSPTKEFPEHLSQWIDREFQKHNFLIECVEPLIDSADATADHWHAVAQHIVESHSDYDGIVVLHGTDTMAYTASALSFLLLGLSKPIVLTGAQIPFFASASDAKRNVSGALAWAMDDRIREVCIYFDGVLLRGNRSLKFSTCIGDSYASPHWPALARLEPDITINEEALLKPQLSQPTLPKRLAIDVGLVKIYPGLSDRLLLAAADAHSSGLVVELYGAGTAPTLNSQLRRALEELSLRKIPVIGVSQCMRGSVAQSAYVSSRVLRDAGVIAGHDLTAEAALSKLHYLRSADCPINELEAALQRNLAGEITLFAGITS